MGYGMQIPAHRVGGPKKLWDFRVYGLSESWVKRVPTVQSRSESDERRRLALVNIQGSFNNGGLIAKDHIQRTTYRDLSKAAVLTKLVPDSTAQENARL